MGGFGPIFHRLKIRSNGKPEASLTSFAPIALERPCSRGYRPRESNSESGIINGGRSHLTSPLRIDPVIMLDSMIVLLIQDRLFVQVGTLKPMKTGYFHPDIDTIFCLSLFSPLRILP